MKKIFTIGFGLICLLAAMIVTAGAVESITLREAPDVSPQSWLYPIWQIISPILITIGAPLGAALAALIAGQIVKLLSIKDASAQKTLEAQVRDALHQAAINGLKYAIAKRTGPVGDMIAGAIPDDIVSDAISYVRTKNPDASALVSAGDLTQIILSKAVDLQTQIAGSTKQTPTVTAETSPPIPSKA